MEELHGSAPSSTVEFILFNYYTYPIDFGSLPSTDMLKEVSIPTGSNEQHIRGAWSEQVVGSNSTPTRTEQLGIYVGEGMTPVLKKLAEKIWQWEFMDMRELLPDGWVQGKSEDGAAGSAMALTRRKRQVTDVNTWVQGFAVYTSVLSLKHPEVVPELLAYMVSII